MANDLELYEFQVDDVEYLKHQTGVLILNEMGTGKTREGIALDLIRRQEDSEGITLVVAPLSVLPSWKSHFEEFTDLSVRMIDNKKRELFLKDPLPDVLLLHWEGVRLLAKELSDIDFLHIIADECHRAQNRKTRWTQALKQLTTKYKTGLSGTAITGEPSRLWSILDWLYPRGKGQPEDYKKYFQSYWRFYGKFVDYDIIQPGGYHKINGPKNLDLLHDIIAPISVRHLKKSQCCSHHPQGVLPYLPDKYYDVVEVELTPKQKTAYKQMKKDMLAWIGQNEDQPVPAAVVIAQLMRLQQFACAYAELDFQGNIKLSEPSSKLDEVLRIIQDANDKQFVVFSQFAQLIKMLNVRLKDKGIPYVSIMGDVPQSLRGSMVEKFQAGEKRIFTGTIGAGGEGITLTAASTVIFLDRSWNPAMNLQAEDRLHRIGQKDAVQVIDIIAKDTVDLGKKQKLERKWSWIRQVLGDI